MFRLGGRRDQLTGGGGCALLWCALLCLQLSAARADLAIYHFDVGMGDATLIRDTATQQSLLIDAGNVGWGRKVIAPALDRLTDARVDYFIATHFDADHIGGFPELSKAGIEVVKVLDRGDFTDRSVRTPRNRVTVYGRYLETRRESEHVLGEPSCAPAISLSDDTKIYIVAVAGRYLQSDCTVGDLRIAKQDDNDLSIALLVRHLQFSYFIGGDLTGGGSGTRDVESLVAACVGNVDVLKVNHHGSLTSSNDTFIEELAPEVAVISVGDGGVNKQYRLPRPAVLNRLIARESPAAVFMTNRGEGGRVLTARISDDHVIIHTDGRSYSVNDAVFAVDERTQLRRRDRGCQYES